MRAIDTAAVIHVEGYLATNSGPRRVTPDPVAAHEVRGKRSREVGDDRSERRVRDSVCVDDEERYLADAEGDARRRCVTGELCDGALTALVVRTELVER